MFCYTLYNIIFIFLSLTPQTQSIYNAKKKYNKGMLHPIHIPNIQETIPPHIIALTFK